jgi:hypothetical protein
MKTVKLNWNLIHSAGSYRGRGFNKKQLDLLGVNWPPKHGWLTWLIGQEIPVEIWQQVLSLKGQAKWKLKRNSRPWAAHARLEAQ